MRSFQFFLNQKIYDSFSVVFSKGGLWYHRFQLTVKTLYCPGIATTRLIIVGSMMCNDTRAAVAVQQVGRSFRYLTCPFEGRLTETSNVFVPITESL